MGRIEYNVSLQTLGHSLNDVLVKRWKMPEDCENELKRISMTFNQRVALFFCGFACVTSTEMQTCTLWMMLDHLCDFMPPKPMLMLWDEVIQRLWHKSVSSARWPWQKQKTRVKTQGNWATVVERIIDFTRSNSDDAINQDTICCCPWQFSYLDLLAPI